MILALGSVAHRRPRRRRADRAGRAGHAQVDDQHRPAGPGRRGEAARRVPQDPRARPGDHRCRSSTRCRHVDMREIPVPGDRQDVITKDNVVVTVNATIFTQVVDAKQALFSVEELRRRHRRAGPHRAAVGHRHDDPRRGAVRARAHQHRRAGADGGRHRQVGHPHQPHRDRRDRAAAADPPGAGPAEAGRPGEAGQDPPVRGRAAVGHQRGRGRGPGRRRGGRGRAPGRHPAGRGHPPGRHPRGRGPGPGHRRPSTAPSRRPTPTRRSSPSSSSTRWPSSPTATTPRSSCPTRASGSWARPRPSRSVLGAGAATNGSRLTAPSGPVRWHGLDVAEPRSVRTRRSFGTLTIWGTERRLPA